MVRLLQKYKKTGNSLAKVLNKILKSYLVCQEYPTSSSPATVAFLIWAAVVLLEVRSMQIAIQKKYIIHSQFCFPTA